MSKLEKLKGMCSAIGGEFDSDFGVCKVKVDDKKLLIRLSDKDVDLTKRFLLFGYDNYYPEGGMSDYIKSFNDIKEIFNFISSELRKLYALYDFDNYEILDTKNGIVFEISQEEEFS